MTDKSGPALAADGPLIDEPLKKLIEDGTGQHGGKM
jgi:hypothetical protein